MDQVCRANGIAYYHFLQPNQHLPGTKRIGQEESRRALWGAHRLYRSAVRRGYPRLIAEGKELARSGVRFHDLTTIFADHPEPLYIDNCCHVSPEGYRIIAKAIGKTIVNDEIRIKNDEEMAGSE
jgi:hypothetical protein